MSKEKQARREKMEGKNAPGNVKKSNSSEAGAIDGFQVTNKERMSLAANMAIGDKMMNDPQTPETYMIPQSGPMDNPYRDGKVFTPAMTTVMPQPASGMQAFAPGQGLNSMAPIGMQQQPIQSEDLMLAQTYNARNYTTEMSPMGMIGAPAQPAPGAIDAMQTSQTGMTMPLMGVSSADVATGGVNMKTGKRSK
jgi:hypothetical protein